MCHSCLQMPVSQKEGDPGCYIACAVAHCKHMRKISGFTFMFTSWPLASFPMESLWRLQLRRHNNYQICPRTVHCLSPPTAPRAHPTIGGGGDLSLNCLSCGVLLFFSLTYNLSVSDCFFFSVVFLCLHREPHKAGSVLDAPAVVG